MTAFLGGADSQNGAESLDKLLPRISVIVAVHNAIDTLQQCLDSIAQQTYADVELIVIDGGSIDGSVNVIQQYASHLTYWISEPDQGIYSAWNKAIVQSRGDWVCFLGADDYLRDLDVLELMAKQLAHVPQAINVAYCQIMLLNSNDAELFTLGAPWDDVKRQFKQTMCLPHPGVLHRRSLFSKNGAFDEAFRIAGDYELLLRELAKGDAIFIPGIVMTSMRTGGMSSNPRHSLTMLREVRSAQKKNGFYFPGRIWLMAVARVGVRLFLWELLGEKATRRLLDIGRRCMGLPTYWTVT